MQPSDIPRIEMHRQLYRSYKDRLRIIDAAEKNHISEKTVSRYFKLFALAGRGRSDLEIHDGVGSWSLDHVREILDAIRTEVEQPVAEIDPEYLKGHRQQLFALTVRIQAASKKPVPMSIHWIVTGEWGDPLAGKTTDAPQFEFEDDPLLPSLQIHLKSLGLEGSFATVKHAAEKHRDAVNALMMQVFSKQSIRLLPQKMRITIADHGLQQLALPAAEERLIRSEQRIDGGTIFIGASRWPFKHQGETSLAQQLSEQAFRHVTGSTNGIRVLEALDEARSALQQLNDLFRDADQIRRTIAISSCNRCNPVPG